MAVHTPSRRADATRAARALIGALGIAVAGCAHGGWVVDHPEVAERARARPQAFVDDAYAQWEGLHGLSGSYRVSVSRGVARRSFDLYVIAERPDRLYIEMLDPSASAQGYLVAGPQEIGLWLAEERRLYRGPHRTDAFGRALGLDLDAAETVGVLLGFGIPPEAAAGAVWVADAQRIRVGAGGSFGFLHPLTARFDRLRFAGVEVELGDWAAEPAPIPRRIRVDVPAEDLALELRLASSWTANPARIREAFMVQPPAVPYEELPLEQLVLEGGLLRRGLER